MMLNPLLLNRLERRFGWFAIANLTLILVIAQTLTFFCVKTNPVYMDYLPLIPVLLQAGEAWRLITFMFVPPDTNILFAFFELYIFYFIGTALERLWGAFRYTLFIAIAYVATIAAACISPYHMATNVFIGTSVFLAFARLHPDLEFHLFLVLPVKVKYLAWIAWTILGLTLLTANWPTRWLILAGVSNYLLFFGHEIIDEAKHRQRRRRFMAKR